MSVRGAAKNYFPYVTVSPETDMGADSFLTGDGAGLYDDSPVAELIVSEYTDGAADNRIADDVFHRNGYAYRLHRKRLPYHCYWRC